MQKSCCIKRWNRSRLLKTSPRTHRNEREREKSTTIIIKMHQFLFIAFINVDYRSSLLTGNWLELCKIYRSTRVWSRKMLYAVAEISCFYFSIWAHMYCKRQRSKSSQTIHDRKITVFICISNELASLRAETWELQWLQRGEKHCIQKEQIFVKHACNGVKFFNPLGNTITFFSDRFVDFLRKCIHNTNARFFFNVLAHFGITFNIQYHFFSCFKIAKQTTRSIVKLYQDAMQRDALFLLISVHIANWKTTTTTNMYWKLIYV